MAGSFYGEKILGGLCGIVQLLSHFEGHDFIVFTVDNEFRDVNPGYFF